MMPGCPNSLRNLFRELVLHQCIPGAGVSGRYTAPVRVDRVAVRAVQRDTVAPQVEAQTLEEVVHIRSLEIRQHARLVKHGRSEDVGGQSTCTVPAAAAVPAGTAVPVCAPDVDTLLNIGD